MPDSFLGDFLGLEREKSQYSVPARETTLQPKREELPAPSEQIKAINVQMGPEPAEVEVPKIKLSDASPSLQMEALNEAIDEESSPDYRRALAIERVGLPPETEWEKMGKIGVAESLAGREWVKDAPLLGSAIVAKEAMNAYDDYRALLADQTKPYLTRDERESRLRRVEDAIVKANYLTARGTTWGADVTKVLADMVPFAIEIGLSGGFAGAGKKVAEKAAEKLGKKMGARMLARVGTKVITKSAGAATAGLLSAATVGAPRVVGETLQRMTPEAFVDSKGNTVITREGQDMGEALFKAFLNQSIQYGTEYMGGDIMAGIGAVGRGAARVIPGGQNAIARVGAIYRAAAKRLWDQGGPVRKSIIDMLRSVGYHGPIEEWSEERAGDFLNALTNTDPGNMGLEDERNTLRNRLFKAATPDLRQWSVELASFAVPGAAGAAVSKIGAERQASHETVRQRADQILERERAEAKTPEERAAIPARAVEGSRTWQQAQAEIQSEQAAARPGGETVTTSPVPPPAGSAVAPSQGEVPAPAPEMAAVAAQGGAPSVAPTQMSGAMSAATPEVAPVAPETAPAVSTAMSPEVAAAAEVAKAGYAAKPQDFSEIDTMPIKDVLAEARRLGIERKGDLATSSVALREAVKQGLAQEQAALAQQQAATAAQPAAQVETAPQAEKAATGKETAVAGVPEAALDKTAEKSQTVSEEANRGTGPENLGERTPGGESGVRGLVREDGVGPAGGGERGVSGEGQRTASSGYQEEADAGERLITKEVPPSLINDRGTPFLPKDEWEKCLREPGWGFQRLKKLVAARHNTPGALAALGITTEKFRDIELMARALHRRDMRAMDAAEEAAIQRGRATAKQPARPAEPVAPAAPVAETPAPMLKDGNGRPLTVYHGTDAEFDNFESGKQESVYGATGYHFTSEESNAKFYGDRIVKAQLRMSNPLKFGEVSDYFPESYQEVNALAKAIIDGKTNRDGLLDAGVPESLANVYLAHVQKSGPVDGIILEGTAWEPGRGNSDQYVVFSPDQIVVSKEVPPAPVEVPEPSPSFKPGNLTYNGLRAQMLAVGASSEEAEQVLSLVAAKAAAMGETVDEYVSRRIKEVRQGTDEEAEAAFLQSGKRRFAQVEVRNGKFIVSVFKEGHTAASLAHELGHIFRRDLAGADLAVMERAYAPDGKWTVDAEEDFAKAWERYLANGKAPTAELTGVFEKFKRWMLALFRAIKRQNVEVSPEVRDVFDRMLGGKGEAAAEQAAPAPSAEGIAVETDAAKRQEIMNSLAEGEAILKSGRKVSGAKMTAAELAAVRRAVDKNRAQLGLPTKLTPDESSAGGAEPATPEKLLPEQWEQRGVVFAKRPDGTFKTKGEYTSDEWKAYTDSVIKAKLAEPATSVEAEKAKVLRDIKNRRLTAPASEGGFPDEVKSKIRADSILAFRKMSESLRGRVIDWEIPEGDTPVGRWNDRAAGVKAGLLEESGKLTPKGRAMLMALRELREDGIPMSEYAPRNARIKGPDTSRYAGLGKKTVGTQRVGGRTAWTDTRVIFFGPVPPGLKGERTNVKMKEAIPDGKGYTQVQPERLVMGDNGNTLIRFSNGSHMDPAYYDYVLKNFPGATFEGLPDLRRPFIVRQKGKLAGVVMPVRTNEQIYADTATANQRTAEFIAKLRTDRERLDAEPKLNAESQKRYDVEVGPLLARQAELRELTAKAKQKFQSTAYERESADLSRQMDEAYQRILQTQTLSETIGAIKTLDDYALARQKIAEAKNVSSYYWTSELEKKNSELAAQFNKQQQDRLESVAPGDVLADARGQGFVVTDNEDGDILGYWEDDILRRVEPLDTDRPWKYVPATPEPTPALPGMSRVIPESDYQAAARRLRLRGTEGEGDILALEGEPANSDRLRAAITVGAYHYENAARTGVKGFDLNQAWRREMIGSYGKNIEPDLRRIWTAIKPQRQKIDAAMKATTQKPEAKAAATQAGPEAPAAVPVSQEPAGEPISRHEVRAEIQRLFNVPIRINGFRRSAAGIFKVQPEVIRVKGAYLGNLGVVSHELGHFIGKMLGKLDMSLNVSRELRGLDYKPERRDRHEGFAEYLRHYLTEDDAATAAPLFHKFFTENVLGRNPDLAAKLQQVRGLVTKWREQGAVARVAGDVSFTGKPLRAPGETLRQVLSEKLKSARDRAIAAIKDEAIYLERLEQEARKRGYKPEAGLSFVDRYRAYMNASSAFADRAIADGIFAVSDLKTTLGPSMDAVVKSLNLEGKDAKSKRQEFETATYYAVARHAIESWAQGKNPGMELADAEAVEKQLRTPERAAFAKGLTDINNGLVKMMADAKVITPEEAQVIMGQYETYLPLKRVMDTAGVGPILGGGKNLAKSGSPFRRRRGSGRQVIDPVATTMERVYQFYARAMQQDVMNEVISAVKSVEGLGGMVEQVSPGMKATGFSGAEVKELLKKQGIEADALEGLSDEAKLFLFRPDYTVGKGKPIIRYVNETGGVELYELHPDLYRFVTAMDVYRLPKWADWTFGLATRTMKLGATTINPNFIISNAARDYTTYLMQRQDTGVTNALRPAQAIGLYTYSETMKALGREQDPSVKAFVDMGGRMSTSLGLDYKQLRQKAQDVLDSPLQRAAQRMLRPQDVARDIISIPEVMSRLAEFQNVMGKRGWTRERIKREGLPPKGVLLEAIRAAHEVTVDFRRMGYAGKVANQIIPFFNAAMEGPAKAVRTLREFRSNPRMGAIRMAGLVGSAILYWLLRKDDDDYKEQPAWMKYRFYTIKDSSGKAMYRIPKSYEWGQIGSFVEALLNSYQEKKPDELKGFLSEFFGMSNPLDLPALIKPGVEVATNHDFFREAPIVSEALASRIPEAQTTPYDSELARAIGHWLGVSPAKVEHLMQGYTGGLSRGVIKPTERALGLSQKRPLSRSDIPVVAAFSIRTEPSESVRKFYKERELAEQTKNTARDRGTVSFEVKAKADNMRDIGEALKPMREMLINVSDRDERFAIEKYMIGLARKATGESELQRYPNLFAAKDLPPELAAIRDKEFISKADKLASKPPDEPLNGKTVKERVAEWEEDRRIAREFLSMVGADPEVVRRVYARHLVDTVKTFKAKRDRLVLLTKGLAE